MAVCVNDGVNYVKPEALPAFFMRVASNLKSGAPFVFDVSSPYKLREVLADNVFYYDGESETLLWTNEQRSNSVVLSLTLFVKEGSAYVRHDEVHTQYAHKESAIAAALTIADFTLMEVTADYGAKPNSTTQRLTFYAIKN